MTFVVTYTEGHLGCFTVNADGSLIQHALIDVGQTNQTPQQLVKTAMAMSNTYGWNGFAPIRAQSQPSMPKPMKTRGKGRQQYRQGALQPHEPQASKREQLILDYLRTNPGSTLANVIEGLGLVPDQRITGRWHHYIKRLHDAGAITTTSSQRPYYYSVKAETDG